VNPRIVWITNDLPPRAGGIERFVGELLVRVRPERTLVLGPAGPPEAAAHDRAAPYAVRRASHALRPDRATRRFVRDALAGTRPEVVVLGASWPLAIIAPTIRAVTSAPIVGISHGLEAGVARFGGGRWLRRSLGRLDAVTTISAFTEDALAPVLAGVRTLRLPPGVDPDAMARPGDVTALRRAWGVGDDAPLVGALARLVARKGQDRLVAAWPRVLARVPEARLVVAGEGPLEARLTRAVARLGSAAGTVRLVGRVDDADLATAHAAFDVMALPCRTRLGGLDVEGLGIVYLEAQAAGTPVVVGRSGGAPETLSGPDTGTVVDGRDPAAIADAVVHWLADPAARARAARVAPERVRAAWAWDGIAMRFAALLDEVAAGPRP
jgi:phosphatidylinositol alpha-1,6-mannosyltransferase